MSKTKKYLKIRGRVQGVGFRYFTRKNAQQLNVTGWVKNMPDGSVETVLTGPESNVSEMINRLHKGPSPARVDSIEEMDMDEEHTYNGFSVKR